MSESKQIKAISFRLNLADQKDRELLENLEQGCEAYSSQAAYIKNVLMEYYVLKETELAQQEFLKKIEQSMTTHMSGIQDVVKGEIKRQGLSMMSAIMNGMTFSGGNGEASISEIQNDCQGKQLPQKCDGIPEHLDDILSQFA